MNAAASDRVLELKEQVFKRKFGGVPRNVLVPSTKPQGKIG